MSTLFSIDEALGRDALFGRDQVSDTRSPTVTVSIRCTRPGCTARERVEVDANKPTPDSIPMWRHIGWVETPAGALCPDHRGYRHATNDPQDTLL